MKQVLQPTAALTLSLLAAAVQAQDDSTLSTVVVTGNRGAEQRTVTSSPVPIDVVSAKQLQSTGKPGLMEALSAVIPSLTLPEKTGWDASGIARAPNLRGLSAAEVLVLVNGKRRHTSATLNINGINTGAAPADLDLIHWAEGLPKTRSGKIMRRILRKIATGETDSLGDISTLADPGVVDKLIREKSEAA